MFLALQYYLYQTPWKFSTSSKYTWKDLLKTQNLISSFPRKTLKTSKIIIKIIQNFKYVWPLFIYILFTGCKWSEVTSSLWHAVPENFPLGPSVPFIFGYAMPTGFTVSIFCSSYSSDTSLRKMTFSNISPRIVKTLPFL